ncbi:MAG: polysaccharide deacetylase family protein [Eubacterium sp.]|nr:polysaccharide deacetylase family protein [Eubacterium sp.]
MDRLYIVMYHYVRPIAGSDYPGIKGLELDLFRQQIEYFSKNFHVVTMEEVMDSLEGKKSLPPKSLLLTFDDGYIDHYRYVFPLLKEYGMQGSFFVPSGILKYKKVLDVNKIHFILACGQVDELVKEIFSMMDDLRAGGLELEENQVIFEKLAVANRWDSKEVIFIKRLLQTYLPEEIRGQMVDRLFEKTVGRSEEDFSRELYMNLDQIREMKEAGMFFGLHGERHYWLNQLPEDKMKEDIGNSLKYFESVIDPDYLAINYPYGGYNQEVVDYAKEIGCKIGFSVEARPVDYKKDNPLTLPRLDTNDFPPKSRHWEDFL